MSPKDAKFQPLLFLGDANAILVVIFIGLRFHQSQELLASRLMFNYLPFLLAWLVAANVVGLLRGQNSVQWRGLWQLPIAAALAAPLGAAVRGLLLGREILPIFVFVMFLALAFGLLIWRAIYTAFIAPRWSFK